MAKKLTRQALLELAKAFCANQSNAPHAELFGVTDGKAVGTHVEHLFQASVLEKFDIGAGSSAKGIDLPPSTLTSKLHRSSNPNHPVLSNRRVKRFMDSATTCCYSSTKRETTKRSAWQN